jgi:hypothetical protein
MQDRFRKSRLRRRLALALPVAGAALVFAGTASAATVAPVIYTPTTEAALESAISSADGAAPGTLSIIQLCGCSYQPTTASLTLSGNIELTGPPTDQGAQGTDPNVNGTQLFNLSPTPPLIVISAGANVLIKGVDIAAGGGNGANAVEDFGNLELDNSTIGGAQGTGLNVDSGGTAVVSNSDLSGNIFDALASSGTVTLVQDTFAYNGAGAIAGPGISSYNTYFFKNKQVSGAGACEANTSTDTFTSDYNDDSSCGTTGVTVALDRNLPTGQQIFAGGPSQTVPLNSGNQAIGKGNPLYCPTADQRFFLYTQGSGGTCDVGSYQTTGAQDTSTTGPACAVASTNESSNPAVPSTQTVNVTEAGGIGIGADSVNNTTTNNGMVSTPAVGTSWFNAVNSGLSVDQAYPSVGPYGVTATKPAGDLTVGDTKWSFFATDWLGNTTLCQ